ncbi:MAG: DUF6526 family protein [Acidobacteriota bacterium]
MADPRPQTLANHAKIVPAYHYALTLILVANLLWSLWQLLRNPGIDSAITVLLAFGLMIIMWFVRIWPLTVQDRLIRLEEILRMQRLLPPEQQERIGSLRRGQFVALRFASDDELPALVQRVLDGELTSGKEIKRAIATWRADHFRV